MLQLTKRPALIGLLILNLVFAAVVLVWMFKIPVHGCPDEFVHFESNVKFILDNGRLPVTGRDDISLLKTCRENNYGIMPCTNSYNIYPAVNYIVSAGVAKLLHGIFGLDYFHGSRVASLLWGLLFLNGSFLAVRRVIRRELDALFLIIPFVLIPQILFVTSYTNQDIHALALSALSFWLLARAYEDPTKGRLVSLGVALGLLFSSKYNYFVFVPWLALLPWFFRVKTSQGMKPSFRTAGVVVGIAALVASPWYLRNLYLYHDALGQDYVINLMFQNHAPGRAWPLLSVDSFRMMYGNGWARAVFRSFFAVFGYMNLYLPDWQYGLLVIATVVTGFSMVYHTFQVGSSDVRRAAGFLLIHIALTVGLSIAHTLQIDFQAQGRYLFPLVVPIMAFAAYLVRTRPGMIRALLLWGGLMIYTLFSSIELILASY